MSKLDTEEDRELYLLLSEEPLLRTGVRERFLRDFMRTLPKTQVKIREWSLTARLNLAKHLRILMIPLFIFMLSGCAIFGEIGGRSDGGCVRNARIQDERYYNAGFPTRYGCHVNKNKLWPNHIWAEYFKDGRWHRTPDTIFFKRKATYYKEREYLLPGGEYEKNLHRGRTQ